MLAGLKVGVMKADRKNIMQKRKNWCSKLVFGIFFCAGFQSRCLSVSPAYCPAVRRHFVTQSKNSSFSLATGALESVKKLIRSWDEMPTDGKAPGLNADGTEFFSFLSASGLTAFCSAGFLSHYHWYPPPPLLPPLLLASYYNSNLKTFGTILTMQIPKAILPYRVM